MLLIEWVKDQKEFVCFQIKGEWDLAQKRNLKDLKAQYVDAKTTYGDKLRAYYIVICCSTVKKVKKENRTELVTDKSKKEKIKNIIRDLSNENLVRIVEPEFAAAFLALNPIQIDVIVKGRFGNEDIVFKEAIQLTRDLSDTQKAIVVYSLWLILYGGHSEISAEDILRSQFIQRTLPKLSDELDEDDDLPEIYGYSLGDVDDTDIVDSVGYSRNYAPELDSLVARDLARLEGILFEPADGNQYHLPLQSVQPLAVLMMDGNIRYDYTRDELLTYALTLLGVRNIDSEQ